MRRGSRSSSSSRCQPGLTQIRRVGEPCGVTGNDADSRTAVASAGDLLDPAVIETSGGRRFVFGIHLRKFGASAYRSGEDSFEDISIDHPDQDRTRSET